MELNFGITPEDEKARIRNFLNRLWEDAYGEGGFKDMVEFMTTYKATMAERKEQEAAHHKSNRWKLDFLIALGVLIVAVLALLLTFATQHKVELQLPEIFNHQSHHQIYTAKDSIPQTAQGD